MSFTEELRDVVSDSLDAFSSLYWRWQIAIVGGVFIAIVMTYLAWKLMLPFIMLAVGTTIYLRRSRGRDSL